MADVQNDIFSNDPQTLASMIRVDVEEGRLDYRHPLSGLFIVQCLLKIREPQEPEAVSEWIEFLKNEFPDMDEKTRADYLFVAQRTTPESRYFLPVFDAGGLEKARAFLEDLHAKNPDSDGYVRCLFSTRPANGGRRRAGGSKSKKRGNR